jgi:mRNA-degrading endonuclease RelE of RelBE toxin-antitoxin system
MNTFSIKIKEPAEEWLKKYDKNIQQRFVNKIRKLKENPELYGKPLRKPLHGYWEIYFEKKFRIFYTIDLVNQVVYI